MKEIKVSKPFLLVWWLFALLIFIGPKGWFEALMIWGMTVILFIPAGKIKEEEREIFNNKDMD